MLPQEKFAFKYLYEGHFLGHIPWSLTKEIEALMAECHLKYRKGKGVRDLREAFWGYDSMFHRGYDSHVEWALERADKVWTLNWTTLLKI